MTNGSPVLEARNLTKLFGARRGGKDDTGARRGPLGRRGTVHAVQDVSLALRRGAVTAIVGESGCGKSTLVRMLARIITPTSGELHLDGQPVPLRQRRHRDYAARVQLVLQDPFASLNPVHTVHHHLARALRIHRHTGGDVDAAIEELLHRVALEPPGQFTGKYPHELSGGQRQRVAIARALAVAPDVLLADEPVSMLDVSIRLGVLNLLADLRDRSGLAIAYVTHDIASARYLADTIIVMYAGEVVEVAPSVSLTDSPAHPYTQLLLAAAPDPGRRQRPSLAGRGAPPSLLSPPSGCRFHPRCPHAMEICTRQAPPRTQLAPGHTAACWLHAASDGERTRAAASGSVTKPGVTEPGEETR